MAEYIFTPTDIEHPTKEELQFIVRHLGHDFRGDARNSAILIDELRARAKEPVDLKGLQDLVEELVPQAKNYILHGKFIVDALHQLGSGQKSNSRVNMATLLEKLQSYYQMRYRRFPASFKVQVNADCKCTTAEEVVYLQLFNFAQNAIIAPMRVVFGAETLNLTSTELAYLGKRAQQYYSEDTFVRAYVQDHGVGIPEDRLKDLFKPRNPKNERGVGLSLVDCVCDALGGFIKVESEVGKGSTFSLYFPQERKS